MFSSIEISIEKIKSGKHENPIEMHEKIKSWYSWRDIAKRTEKVYNLIAENNSSYKLSDKLKRYYSNRINFIKNFLNLISLLLRFRRCGYIGYWVIAFIFLIDYLVIEFFNFINQKKIAKRYI